MKYILVELCIIIFFSFVFAISGWLINKDKKSKRYTNKEINELEMKNREKL